MLIVLMAVQKIAGLAFGWQTPRSGCYWRKFLSDNLAATYDIDAFGQGRWVGAHVATIQGVDGGRLGGIGAIICFLITILKFFNYRLQRYPFPLKRPLPHIAQTLLYVTSRPVLTVAP